MMSRVRFIYSTLIAGVAAVCSGCAEKQTLAPAPLQTVSTGVVQTNQSNAPERYSVTFSELADVSLAFKSSGLIVSILQVRGADGKLRDVQVGDKVSAGDELALVRQIDYRQKVDGAQQQVSQAQAQSAQAQYELAHAQAEQLRAQAELDHATIDFKRAEILYRSGSLIKPEYDRDKAQFDADTAQVEAAKAQVEAAKATVEVTKAQIGNAQVGVQEADLSLADTSLKAPFTGWITAINVNRGSMVGATTVGFSMLDSHIVKANFGVPDTSLKYVRIGHQIRADVDALGQSVTGLVHVVAAVSDPKTHVFNVEVFVPNPDEKVRPGMLGTVALQTGGASASHVVAPLSAVVRDPANSNGFALFRTEVRGGKTFAIAKPVTLGETVGNSIEIKNGAAPGDRIVVMGVELLKNGQEIRTIP
jgi:RND family efflux transporter MFP subunit